MNTPQYLSPEQLSARWHNTVSVPKLKRWRDSGTQGPGYMQIEGKPLYLLSEIEKYEQAHLVNTIKEGDSVNTLDFSYLGKTVRIIDVGGEPWWVASDVCEVLGLTNPTESLRSLDDDEKNTLSFSEGIPGNPNRNIISESGLYTLIIRSNKPEALEFRRWITHEVLPSIRKKGSYSVPGALESKIDKVLDLMVSFIDSQITAKHEFSSVSFDQKRRPAALRMDSRRTHRATTTSRLHVNDWRRMKAIITDVERQTDCKVSMPDVIKLALDSLETTGIKNISINY